MFRKAGFTLLEILLALFIFSILSLIIVNALSSVLNAQASTEKHALRLAQPQIAFTLLSRDFEQTIERPIITAAGGEEVAFLGTHESTTFTHAGLFNAMEQSPRSSLQRTKYKLEKGNLIRETWPALDRTKATKSLQRIILTHVTQFNVEYLDQDSQFQTTWPPAVPGKNGALPRAVRITITLNDLGKITQLYVIPKQQAKQN